MDANWMYLNLFTQLLKTFAFIVWAKIGLNEVGAAAVDGDIMAAAKNNAVVIGSK